MNRKKKKYAETHHKEVPMDFCLKAAFQSSSVSWAQLSHWMVSREKYSCEEVNMSHPTKLSGYLPLLPPAFVLSEIGNQCFVDLCTIMQIKDAGGHFTPMSDFTLGITHWLYPRPTLAIGSSSRIPSDVAIWWGRLVLCVGGQHSRKKGERKRRGSALKGEAQGESAAKCFIITDIFTNKGCGCC